MKGKVTPWAVLAISFLPHRKTQFAKADGTSGRSSSSGLCLVHLKPSLPPAPGHMHGAGQKGQIPPQALQRWPGVLLTHTKTNALSKSWAVAGQLCTWRVKTAPWVMTGHNTCIKSESSRDKRHLWGLKYGLQERPAAEDSPGPGHLPPPWPDRRS